MLNGRPLRRLGPRLGDLRRLARLDFAVLPDFFVDHFVTLPPWAEARRRMEEIARRGGGSWPDLPQRLGSGGNAANTAVALARLGARVRLITQADAVGRTLLESAGAGTRLDLRHVEAVPVSAMTTALEFGNAANVMLSHAGPVLDFGPDRISEKAWKTIEASDVVTVTNWSLNRRGTPLAKSVLGRARRAGAWTFFDTADPSSRLSEAPRLFREVLGRQDLDAWGLNENELARFTQRDAPAASQEALLERLDELERRVRARVDLHTAGFAATREDGERVVVPSVRVDVRRLTGAGDAWNAGNLAAQALGWEARDRLLLAHAVAAYYVSAPEGRHPSPQDLARFVRSR